MTYRFAVGIGVAILVCLVLGILKRPVEPNPDEYSLAFHDLTRCVISVQAHLRLLVLLPLHHPDGMEVQDGGEDGQESGDNQEERPVRGWSGSDV